MFSKKTRLSANALQRFRVRERQQSGQRGMPIGHGHSLQFEEKIGHVCHTVSGCSRLLRHRQFTAILELAMLLFTGYGHQDYPELRGYCPSTSMAITTFSSVSTKIHRYLTGP